jgi:hypothetical protein
MSWYNKIKREGERVRKIVFSWIVFWAACTFCYGRGYEPLKPGDEGYNPGWEKAEREQNKPTFNPQEQKVISKGWIAAILLVSIVPLTVILLIGASKER